jgi:hypothetical protein
MVFECYSLPSPPGGPGEVTETLDSTNWTPLNTDGIDHTSRLPVETLCMSFLFGLYANDKPSTPADLMCTCNRWSSILLNMPGAPSWVKLTWLTQSKVVWNFADKRRKWLLDVLWVAKGIILIKDERTRWRRGGGEIDEMPLKGVWHKSRNGIGARRMGMNIWNERVCLSLRRGGWTEIDGTFATRPGLPFFGKVGPGR